MLTKKFLFVVSEKQKFFLMKMELLSLFYIQKYSLKINEFFNAFQFVKIPIEKSLNSKMPRFEKSHLEKSQF